MLLVYYLYVIVCFPIMHDSICKKMGGQLDNRMLQWQPAKCCIFQLFIIICYLVNKIPFVSEMMILEYSLVMAEGCQRQNWTVYCHMLRRVVLNF